jgi:hypothetical protein
VAIVRWRRSWVRVGVIAERSGNPRDTDPWRWSCGFYPCSDPRYHRDGTAANFQAARAAFESAWRDCLPLRTGADFEDWGHHQAATAEKYGRLECPVCGRTFDMRDLGQVFVHEHDGAEMPAIVLSEDPSGAKS